MLQKSPTLWRGIRRHGAGWQAEVRVTGHPRSLQAFPLETDPATMQKWRTKEKRRLRELKPRGAGTFTRDAENYLSAKKAMPTFKERKRHIELWIEIFKGRHRSTIKAWEIAAQRDRWLTEGPLRVWRKWSDDDIPKRGGRFVDVPGPLSASQVNKRLRALENLWTVLDGSKADNPVREAGEAVEPEAEARGLPYALIEALLAAMPDRGRAKKGEKRSTVSLAKLRQAAIAYVGLSHGELEGISAADLHLDESPPWVWIAGRRKGKGTEGTAQLLTERGAEALRTLQAAEGLGPFAAGPLRIALKRACRQVAPDGSLDHLTPYMLRHSFATEVFEKTGNLEVTRLMMRHKDGRTTIRYSKRAIAPVLSAAVKLLEEKGGFKP